MQLRSLKLIAAGALALAAVPALTQQAPSPKPSAPMAKALVALPATGAATMTKADVDAWLDGHLPYALKRGDIAGAVVIVVKDGQVLTQRGFGYADAARRKPVDPDKTLFRPGSVSKLFTWTAVMQQVEQGKIDLDKDVNTYLDFKIPARADGPITMRHLLTHTPGFDESARGNFSSDPKFVVELSETMKRPVPARIFKAGSTPAYSNYGTALAGYIVQRVSGMPFDDYLDAHVFAPTGMTRSTFRQPLPAKLQPLMSQGYKLGSGQPVPFEMISVGPAGSLSASGADMGKFMIAHLNNGGALLKPETARLMHDTKLEMLPPLNRMALGFFEENINGRPVIGHGGDTLAFHSHLWLFPKENVGLFISMNSGGAGDVSLALRENLLDSFADRYFPANDTDGRVDPATAAEHARMMAGAYNMTRRTESSFMKVLELAGQYKVSVNDKGRMVFDMLPGTGGQSREWIEIAPFVWRDQGSKQRLAAQVVDGKVVRFSFDMLAPAMVFEPVSWYQSTAWLTPALLFSMGALALTAFAWPAAAITRRRFGAKLALSGNDLKAYRLVRGLGGLAVAVLVGWATVTLTMMADFTLMNGSIDWAIILLQILTPLVFVGLVGVAGWNLWLIWKGKRGWFSKLWSAVLLLSAIVLLWVALAFNLIGFGLTF